MGNTKRRSIMFRRDVTTNEAASELDVQVWKFLLLVKEHEITPTRLIGNSKMWDAVDVVMISFQGGYTFYSPAFTLHCWGQCLFTQGSGCLTSPHLRNTKRYGMSLPRNGCSDECKKRSIQDDSG